jgi:DNA-binding NarL/FixJ family response regulator
MNTGARQAVRSVVADEGQRSNGHGRDIGGLLSTGRAAGSRERSGRIRVFVAAENRLLQEHLTRMLVRRPDIEVLSRGLGPVEAEALQEEAPDILLLTSQGNVSEDLAVIQNVKAAAPDVQMLLLGIREDEEEFLQYIRAGIKGYLMQDASAEGVLGAISALRNGQVACPAALCALLFQYCERAAMELPSVELHQRLGLTRREQQLIPLLARGMTNKEIANHFCLSEQTVKNHLYRMKQKVGADGRLGIVEACRTARL